MSAPTPGQFAGEEGETELADLRRQLDEARHRLVAAEKDARTLRGELTRYRSSASGRVVLRLQRGARVLAPSGTRRQAALHGVAQTVAALVERGPRGVAEHVRRSPRMVAGVDGFDDSDAGRQRQYQEWLRRHHLDANDLEQMREAQDHWAAPPRVSIVMPVHDPRRHWLDEALASVRTQIYPNWQLCIADDGSTQPHVREQLERACSEDTRIRLVVLAPARGIAAASNAALSLADGELVTFLDHDDVLRPHALHRMVAYLQHHPDVDVLYSDEDKILPAGGLGDPFFKPDYSPEMLLAWNYVTHMVVIRKDVVDRVGGLREGYEGSQDHDLLLRATEIAREVGHVSDVLYAWRMVEGSAALSSDYKPLARESGRRAVEDAVLRRGEDARVEFGAHPGLYDVRYAIRGDPSVHIVIPTRDRVRLLRECLDSIERLTTYGNYTITVVDNGSRSRKTLAYLAATSHRVTHHDGPFNFSAIVNRAVRAVQADHVVLLNNDTVVITPGWIEAMLEQSQRPDVGAVGARLLFRDGRVQHEGIVLGRLHVAANVETRWAVSREVSAVTAACLMTPRAVFDEAGGFDENLAEAFNDVDYCLRVRGRGYRVLFTPHAELYHREGGTRGRRIPLRDERRFTSTWGDASAIEDPYLNPNVLWPHPLRLRMD